MQWDKVKNVLIVILAAVNVFLLANLGIRIGQEQERKAALEDSVRTLAAECGVTIADAFDLPADKSLPELSIDPQAVRTRRRRQPPCWGTTPSAPRQDDGTVVFESARGTVRWAADGRVEGSFPDRGDCAAGRKRCAAAGPPPAGGLAASRSGCADWIRMA